MRKSPNQGFFLFAIKRRIKMKTTLMKLAPWFNFLGIIGAIIDLTCDKDKTKAKALELIRENPEMVNEYLKVDDTQENLPL